MTTFRRSSAAAVLACLALCGCHRGGDRHDERAGAAPPVAAAPTPVRPARMMRMVCRNSRDGRNVPCGAPDAVMVGMKEQ